MYFFFFRLQKYEKCLYLCTLKGKKMKKRLIFLILTALAVPQASLGQKADAQAYYTDKNGMEVQSTEIDAEELTLPLNITFRANPSDVEDRKVSYEWHFFKDGDQSGGLKELFVRYEEDTEYAFSEQGTYQVELRAFLDNESEPFYTSAIQVVIPSSALSFYNVVSPNNDGKNDELIPKTCKGIVKFHAYIFTRTGQKIHEWTDPNGSWDGKHNGQPVNDGVYFLLVKATGSDGREYNIRQAINVMKGEDINEKGNSGN